MNQKLSSVDGWARYVKMSNGKWKDIHTQFIDAQFQKSQKFLEKLSKERNGKQKIIKLYNIKNKKGYPFLFNSR